MDGEHISDFFEDSEDIFSVLEALDGVSGLITEDEEGIKGGLISQKSTYSSSVVQESEIEFEASPKCKKQKVESNNIHGQQRISHITVERNRRKQMNEHLSVLRSLMPSFYVKRVCFFFNLDAFLLRQKDMFLLL